MKVPLKDNSATTPKLNPMKGLWRQYQVSLGLGVEEIIRKRKKRRKRKRRKKFAHFGNRRAKTENPRVKIKDDAKLVKITESSRPLRVKNTGCYSRRKRSRFGHITQTDKDRFTVHR